MENLHRAQKSRRRRAFVKTQLKRLPQEEETWEGDFRSLPKPQAQRAPHNLGVVVTQPHGFLRAHKEIKSKPTVNDLATLVAHAMRRPLTEGAHRPSRLLLRGHRQWQELFPSIAKWVRGHGYIEIGDQEGFGFVVRALDYGGLVFEDDKPDTLAEALAALEKTLVEYFERGEVD